jgi:hypothetical protein
MLFKIAATAAPEGPPPCAGRGFVSLSRAARICFGSALKQIKLACSQKIVKLFFEEVGGVLL